MLLIYNLRIRNTDPRFRLVSCYKKHFLAESQMKNAVSYMWDVNCMSLGDELIKELIVSSIKPPLETFSGLNEVNICAVKNVVLFIPYVIRQAKWTASFATGYR